jgi:ABC-type Na+ efflux pump permease subunit
MANENNVRLLVVAALLVIGVAVWAYVELRTKKARRRGDDVQDARRSALTEALPVAGASLVGLFAFIGAILAIPTLVLLAVLNGSIFTDPERVGSHLGWILVTGMVALVALPILALAVVVSLKLWRRRRR